MSYVGPDPLPLNIPPGANIPVTALDPATAAKVNGAVQKSGDTMTGQLTVNGSVNNAAINSNGGNVLIGNAPAGTYSYALQFKSTPSGPWQPYINATDDNVNRRLNFSMTGGAGNLGWFNDSGDFSVTRNATIGQALQANAINLYGALKFWNGAKAMQYLSTDPGFPNGGATGMINAEGTAWNWWSGNDGTFNVKGALNIGGQLTINGAGFWTNQSCTINGDLYMDNRSGATNGQIALQNTQGGRMYMRGAGGGMEWINNAYSKSVAYMGDSGDFTCNSLNTNGGVNHTYGPYYYLAGVGTGGPVASVTAAVALWAPNYRVVCAECDALSDERRKEDIKQIPLELALEFVKRIDPMQFVWKEDGDKRPKFGYIAQHLMKKGFGNVVTVYDSPGMEETTDEDGFISPADKKMTMNNAEVTPLYGVVIRHLLNVIDDLQTRLAALESAK